METMNIRVCLKSGSYLAVWVYKKSFRTSLFRVWCHVNWGDTYYRAWRWKGLSTYYLKYPALQTHTARTIDTNVLNKIKDKKNMLFSSQTM